MEADHPLCSDCIPLGKCRFSQDANEIAVTKMAPLKKNETIAKMRIDARNRKQCPNINDVNPKIEGL